MGLDRLVDVERYLDPAQRAAVISRAQQAIATHGSVILEDFVRPRALVSMLNEALAVETDAYRRDGGYSAYLAEEMTGDADHPTRRLHRYALGSVANDQLDPDGALNALYRDGLFVRLIADILDVSELYPLGDPMLGLTLTYLGEGDEHGWHFDANDFVVSLLLQDAHEGGVFEFAPFVRSADEPNFSTIKKIMNGERVLLHTIRAKPGTLAIFAGKRSLHRVSPVSGNRTRIIALFSYDTTPNLVHDDAVHMRTFGRRPLAI